jgi:hypothetical protein
MMLRTQDSGHDGPWDNEAASSTGAQARAQATARALSVVLPRPAEVVRPRASVQEMTAAEPEAKAAGGNP